MNNKQIKEFSEAIKEFSEEGTAGMQSFINFWEEKLKEDIQIKIRQKKKKSDLEQQLRDIQRFKVFFSVYCDLDSVVKQNGKNTQEKKAKEDMVIKLWKEGKTVLEIKRAVDAWLIERGENYCIGRQTIYNIIQQFKDRGES